MNQTTAMKLWGEFGIRHQALTQKQLREYRVGTAVDVEPGHKLGWFRVEKDQAGSRNTPVLDAHGWARTHIGPLVHEGLIMYAGGPGSGRHKEHGKFQNWQDKPNVGLKMWRSKSGTSIVRRKASDGKEEVLEYDKKKGLTQRRSFTNSDATTNHLNERYGIRAATVRRIVNPAPSDGPELYETRNNKGEILQQFRDKAGADIAKEAGDRARFGLGKEYKALKKANALKYGVNIIEDNRLRPTTGGTGGTGGAGNG